MNIDIHAVRVTLARHRDSIADDQRILEYLHEQTDQYERSQGRSEQAIRGVLLALADRYPETYAQLSDDDRRLP